MKPCDALACRFVGRIVAALNAGRAQALLAVSLAVLLIGLSSPTIITGAPLADGPDRIDAPANGATVSGVVEIQGRATGPDVSQFSFYRILIGEGKDPPSMRPLGPPYDTPVEDGMLATWDTDRFPAGEYTLMLQVYDVDDDVTSTTFVVTVAGRATPTPFVAPSVLGTPVEEAEPAPAAAPPSESVAPAPSGDGTIPIDLPTFDSQPTLAPLPIAPGPTGPGVPINPIPIDPNSPPPVRLDTPAQTDTSQLPFAPAPVYLTPVEFNP